MVDAVLYGLIVGMVIVGILAIVRAFKGPSALDRVVAMNVITTSAVLIILSFSYLKGSLFYMDVAFVFTLAAFIATLCILKLLREKFML